MKGTGSVQAAHSGDAGRSLGVRHRKKNLMSEAASGTTQSRVFGNAESVEHLIRELIDAFVRDYSEGGKDHALAELLFSVKDLKTPYERRAAAAALESLAGRIDVGFREYPQLVRTSETLAYRVWDERPGVKGRREPAQHSTGVILHLLAAELLRTARR